MKLTYFGHQSWFIEPTEGPAILLDPLLGRMGNGVTKLEVWPKRRIALASLPKESHIIISHEHSDHFNIETLHELKNRGIGSSVYVPVLSSLALKTFIKEMGFNLVEITPFDPIAVGSLKITALPSLKSRLEPDVFALLFEDQTSGGSFFTSIDTVPSPVTIEYLREHCPKRTLDNFTNNFVQRIGDLHTIDGEAPVLDIQSVYESLKSFRESFDPREVVISGQGWFYPDHLSSHNECMFTVTHRQLIDHCRKEGQVNLPFEAGVGDTWYLGTEIQSGPASHLVEVLESEPRNKCSRSKGQHSQTAYCKESLSREAWSQLDGYIKGELGRWLGLGATRLMRALYEQICFPQDQLKGLFLEVRDSVRTEQYVFSYQDCLFQKIESPMARSSAMEKFAFGISCFAGDLEEIVLGREEAHLVSENSMITWNQRPDLLAEPTDVDFMQCFRPQYRPEVFLNHYRNELQRIQGT